MEEKEAIFNNPSLGSLSIKEVVSAIVKFVGEDKNVFYRLVIGTDSQERRLNGSREVEFVTAIVIHRLGKGGRYFWTKSPTKLVYSLREKIYGETLTSLDYAQKLVPILQAELADLAPYDLEIHIDVGEVGPTRVMIKEVVGMVTGNGFVAKTKPESYGASVVADKYT